MIVKRLDEKAQNEDVELAETADLEVIEHVGIALWRAALDWRAQFRAEMAARGHDWHLGARGEVLSHIGPSGRSQADLTNLSGLSKQAVQQLVDQLEADGVLTRVSDPDDRRAKRVELTALGRADFKLRNEVKRQVEEKYRERIGKKRFAKLMRDLAMLVDAPRA